MASSPHSPRLTLPLLLNVFLLSSSVVLAQDTDFAAVPNASIAECTPRFLTLATCASFVQGSAPSPAQTCCDNLVELYDQKPGCLCILLNETSVTAFPINRTLALQLPDLCNLPLTIADCPGLSLKPGSPEALIFKGSQRNNSSLTVTPSSTTTAAWTPRANLGAGLGKTSSGTKLGRFHQGGVVLAHAFMVAASLMAEALHVHF